MEQQGEKQKIYGKQINENKRTLYPPEPLQTAASVDDVNVILIAS